MRNYAVKTEHDPLIYDGLRDFAKQKWYKNNYHHFALKESHGGRAPFSSINITKKASLPSIFLKDFDDDKKRAKQGQTFTKAVCLLNCHVHIARRLLRERGKVF